MDCVESKEYQLIQIMTHEHHINSTLLQTFKNSTKCFQSGKPYKNITALNIRENEKKKGCMGNSHVAWVKKWIRNSPMDGGSLETLREKLKLQQWELRIRNSVQTALGKILKELKVNADYVKNMRKQPNIRMSHLGKRWVHHNI
jgi:hypothetical protein